MITQTKTRLQWIAHYLQAIRNCEASGNYEWRAKHADAVNELMESAPSGSGFDNGTQLAKWTSRRLEFGTSFHHMHESGMYDGWTEHVVIVIATLDGFDIRVRGKDRNGIKEYIGDVFHEWLSEEIAR